MSAQSPPMDVETLARGQDEDRRIAPRERRMFPLEALDITFTALDVTHEQGLSLWRHL
jgi:hypothetical protein